MSEGSARGGTAPLGHAIAGPAGDASAAEVLPPLDPRATQVTASAAPSTLESPKALGGSAAPTAVSPQRADLAGGGLALTVDDVDGAELNDAAMREVARRQAAAAHAERHPIGPPTLVSPGGVGAPVPYPPPPPQVPPPYPDSREASARHGAFGPPGAHGAAPMGPLGAYEARPARRPMSGLLVALIICGLVVVIGGGAILAVTFLVFASERTEAVRTAREPRTSEPAAPTPTPPPLAAPPVPPTPPTVAPGAGARPPPSTHRAPSR
jgi:hypothetical protein